MSDLKDLFTALSKAQAEMPAAKKTKKNPFFNSYYADLAECVEAAKKPLATNGLSVIQTTRVDGENIILVTTLAHSSGQSISGEMPILFGDNKNPAQAMGSAMTYSRRYAYAAIIGMASDDDDDGNAVGGYMSEKPKQEVKKPIANQASDLMEFNKRFKASGWTKENLQAFVKAAYGVDSFSKLNSEEIQEACEAVSMPFSKAMMNIFPEPTFS